MDDTTVSVTPPETPEPEPVPLYRDPAVKKIGFCGEPIQLYYEGFANFYEALGYAKTCGMSEATLQMMIQAVTRRPA